MREVPAARRSLAEQNRVGGALNSSVAGPGDDSIGFLIWLPVIMLGFWKISLFHLSKSQGRAWTEVWLGVFLRCLLSWSWQRPELELLSKVGFATSMNFRN